MNRSELITPLFDTTDRAIACCKAGFLQLDGLWRLLSSLDPWFSLGLFLVCSMLMVFRLNVLERKGLEGTVLGYAGYALRIRFSQPDVCLFTRPPGWQWFGDR
jgi:hypothetical protein